MLLLPGLGQVVDPRHRLDGGRKTSQRDGKQRDMVQFRGRDVFGKCSPDIGMHGAFGTDANCQRQLDQPPRLLVQGSLLRAFLSEVGVCLPDCRVALGQSADSGRQAVAVFVLGLPV